jgi:hypothetical protein
MSCLTAQSGTVWQQRVRLPPWQRNDHGALDVTSIPEVMKVVLVGLALWDYRDQGLPATVPPARIKDRRKLDGEAKLLVVGGIAALFILAGIFVCGWRP